MKKPKERMRFRSIVALAPVVLSGCTGVQSMLHSQGPQARSIENVWWLMFWGALLIFSLVMGLTLYAVLHERGQRVPPNAQRLIIAGGVLLPLITLTGLLVYGMVISDPNGWVQEDDPIVVEITGHRWWWEVRYPTSEGNDLPVVTANEVHIPAGKTVLFVVRTADVIHSFWLPNLGGKIDLIPGHTNRLHLRADRPGAFRGQCAEFCGAQHAHMGFWVYAHDPEGYVRWLAERRDAMSENLGAVRSRGRQQFFEQGCAECHTIRGTPARGNVGPDLTHVGSRRFIAAATLRNTLENRARWIRENQSIKPGNGMDDFSFLDPGTAADLAAFLGTLR